MTNEKLFEIAAGLLTAHIASGQQSNEETVLIPMVSELLPTLFATVRDAWERSAPVINEAPH